MECWKKSLKYPRVEKPETIEGWLKKLYDYSNTCIGNNEACAGYLRAVAKKLAEENCYDLFDFLKIIFDYLNKNSKVGRPFIRAGVSWAVSRPSNEEEYQDKTSGMLYNLYGWLDGYYKAHTMVSGALSHGIKELIENTCNLAAGEAKKICDKMVYTGCTSELPLANARGFLLH